MGKDGIIHWKSKKQGDVEMTVNAAGIDVSNGHSTIAVIRPLGK